MTLKFLYVVCFASAILCLGCQEQKISENSDGKLKSKAAGKTTQTTIIAYYFHRTIRCPSCLAIEANAAKTIENNFKHQLADGTLMWMPVNLEAPEGQEFEKQFEMSANTLVLAKMKDGECVEYKKLEKVWELLNDYNAFSEYVVVEIKQYLKD
jgi:hypothetical protein